ncbi:hypothetical protein ACFLUA_02400 [Chloroflexota bacterium]
MSGIHYVLPIVGLGRGELVAIDGSKIKAVNSRGKNIIRWQMKRIFSELDETNEHEG